MESLLSIRAFLMVARKGSFTAAAEALGLSSSAVSKSVQRLEEELSVKLLQRTTRRISLTEEGTHFFNRAQVLLQDFDALGQEMRAFRGELSGTLKISAPSTLGREVLVAPLARFAERHSGLKLETRFDDRIVDLIAEGLDVCVRTGDLADSSLSALPFFRYEVVLCAAPSLVGRLRALDSLREIAQLPCIGFQVRATGKVMPWLISVDGKAEKLHIRPRLVFEDLTAVRLAAEAGAGVALLPSWSCHTQLQEGSLEEPFPHSRAPARQVWLLFQDGPHLTPRVKAFLEEMKGLRGSLEELYLLS